MPNWCWIVVMAGGVLTLGMLRERLRMRRMERFARQLGFVLQTPFLPDESPPMEVLAERLEGRRATRWGAGLIGVVKGVEFVIAEHETPARGGDATGSANTIGVWHTMVAWPIGQKKMNANYGDLEQHRIQLTCYGSWAASRMKGNLTKANVELLLSQLPEVSHLNGSLESRPIP